MAKVAFQQLGLKYLKPELKSRLDIINNLPPSGHQIIGYKVSILNHGHITVELRFQGIGSDANYYGGEVPTCSYLDITPPYNILSSPIGNSRPYNSNGDYKFKNYPSTSSPREFDFAYFGRNSIDILLYNSNEVVFSGCMISVQHSSFYTISGSRDSHYFSLKAEGDWQDTPSGGSGIGASVPAIIYGPPCPPIWQDWMSEDIYKRLSRSSRKPPRKK